MQCIARCGRAYGLTLNMKKLEQLNCNCSNKPIFDDEDNMVKEKSSIKYLGAQLQADGQIQSEISQKIRETAQNFKVLCRIWNHCYISKSYKYQDFISCIVQKLLYSLESS